MSNVTKSKLPPGPSFIVSQILTWKTASYITLVTFIHFATDAVGVCVPVWTIVASSVIALPAMLYIQSELRYWGDKRAAGALGATLAPKVTGEKLLGLDLIAAILEARKIGYIGDGVTEWTTKFGQTIDMRYMGASHIFTLEPQYLKIVLSTGFEDYEKGDVFRDVWQSLFGTGVFNSDAEMWKFHRSITRPFFSRDRISDFDIFDRHADLVIAKLKERLNQGIAVNIQDLLSRYTMDTATEFLFGQDVKSLSGQLPYPSTYKGYAPPRDHPSDRFTSAFNLAQEYTYPRGFFAKAWRLLEFWEDKVATQRGVTDEFIDPLVYAALQRKEGAKEEREVDDDDETLLDHLVKQTDNFGIIRDEALNILLAGRDTTAALATFAVTMLADHPNVFARLRREVLDTLGPNGKVNRESLREMKYLRAVLNETLRLYPSVPWNIRCPRKGVVWPGVDGGKPIYIPGGTQIHYLPWLMQRRKDLWGPDAEEFDPDRFLDERVKEHLVPNPFIFLPFNAGPRICLGQQFAYNETSVIIARLVQTFKKISLDMDSNPEAKPPAAWASGRGRRTVEKVWVTSDVTVYSKGGVWVKMQEAGPE